MQIPTILVITFVLIIILCAIAIANTAKRDYLPGIITALFIIICVSMLLGTQIGYNHAKHIKPKAKPLITKTITKWLK